MKRLIRPQDLSDLQREGLKRWLQQWNLDLELRQSASHDVSSERQSRGRPSEQAFAELIKPFSQEPLPNVGQIRLLAPELTAENRGPVFAAVLKRTGAGSYLVAPFSRFQTPALPGELQLRNAPQALAVLCLWNARPVSSFVLAQSWFVSPLTDAELRDALVTASVAGQAAAIPDVIADRIGPPLCGIEDPRLQYMDEEGELWREMVFFPSAEAEASQIIQLAGIERSIEATAMQLAAESEEGFACVCVLDVETPRALVHVFTRPRGRMLFLVVSDPAGELSRDLDGTLVSCRDIGLAGRIEAGQCIVEAGDSWDIALRSSSGQFLSVTRTEGSCPVQPLSYVRLVEMLGKNPDAASVMTDTELRHLVRHCPRDGKIETQLKSELYFRVWLYQGNYREEFRAALAETGYPEVDRRFDQILDTIRSQQIWPRDIHGDADIQGKALEVWNLLSGRIASFLQADGVIPVVTGEVGEAIPIAFKLRAEESSGSAIRDIAGIPMPLWDEAEELLGELSTQRMGVQLLCSTRETGRQFDGESFELPIMLAVARARGALPDYPLLTVMASGAIRGGTLAAVAGIDAKVALARRMGVRVFVTPGVAGGDIVMSIPVGTRVDDALQKIDARLEQAGLDRLDTPTAAARLNALGNDIHFGSLSLADASLRLKRYEEALQRDGASRIAVEGLIRARVLRSVIANHTGDATLGARATQDAAGLAAQHRIPLLYVNAMANRIVSLTDLGHLAEAEAEGRHLLAWVLHEFSGSSMEQMQAEMVACGVLGGQPLLHMAIQGGSSGPESLQLLRRALDLAKELRLPSDICRDAVQVVLWHALLQPTLTEQEADKARSLMDEYHGPASDTSRAYLQRARFLGAFRAAWYHGTWVSGSSDWPLPEGHPTHLQWVRATSQKYRGALRARQQSKPAAEQDFAAAWATLDGDPAPFFRFMAGTMALLAGEAFLKDNPPLAMSYLKKARSIFSLQADRFEGSVKGALWLRRTEGLLTGSPVQSLPDPQKSFPY